MEQRIDRAGVSHRFTHHDDVDVATRAGAIRARLGSRMIRERVETARVLCADLYTAAQLEHKIATTLPSRLDYRRGAVLEPIETYRPTIPDDALVKYDDAGETALFAVIAQWA